MLRFLNRHFEEVLGALLLALMVGIAFVNVIVRYCTSFSFAWPEEITTNFFVWIVLLGCACAFRDSNHLSVTLIYNKLPRAVRRICYLASVALCAGFFLLLCYTGTLEVLDEIELERVSDSLELPFYLYSGAVPLFSLLVLFRLFQHLLKDFRDSTF